MICKIICKICKICVTDFNMQNMHRVPCLLMTNCTARHIIQFCASRSACPIRASANRYLLRMVFLSTISLIITVTQITQEQFCLLRIYLGFTQDLLRKYLGFTQKALRTYLETDLDYLGTTQDLLSFNLDNLGKLLTLLINLLRMTYNLLSFDLDYL